MSQMQPHDAVVSDVRRLRSRPPVPPTIPINGYVETGELVEVPEATRVGSAASSRSERLMKTRQILPVVVLVLALQVDSLLAAGQAKVVRIGYQKSGALLLVKQDGSLEKKLAPLGYSVEWREFPSGPPIVEALNANALDVAHSGDAPLILAQAAGVPFVYFGVSAISPESSGIVAPKDSPLRTLAELKGKRVAFAKGSSAHYLVALALEKAGLTFADLNVPPDEVAAPS